MTEIHDDIHSNMTFQCLAEYQTLVRYSIGGGAPKEDHRRSLFAISVPSPATCGFSDDNSDLEIDLETTSL